MKQQIQQQMQHAIPQSTQAYSRMTTTTSSKVTPNNSKTTTTQSPRSNTTVASRQVESWRDDTLNHKLNDLDVTCYFVLLGIFIVLILLFVCGLVHGMCCSHNELLAKGALIIILFNVCDVVSGNAICFFFVWFVSHLQFVSGQYTPHTIHIGD